MTKDQTKNAKDGIDYRDDGTIVVGYEDEVWTLASPKFGTFRDLVKKLFEAGEHLKEVAGANSVTMESLALAGMNTSAVLPGMQPIVDAAQDDVIALLRWTFEQLADHPLPESEDDWPTWLVAADNIVSSFVNHWKTVPLGRGSKR